MADRRAGPVGGQTDRLADRRTDGQTDGRVDRRTDGQSGQSGGCTVGQADRLTGGQVDRRTGGQADRRTGGQADRQKCGHSLLFQGGWGYRVATSIIQFFPIAHVIECYIILLCLIV